MFQNAIIIHAIMFRANTYVILRIIQHSSSRMEFGDQSTRADQMEYLKMKHDVHDKQIAYLMDRICQLPGENVQLNNPEGLISNL